MQTDTFRSRVIDEFEKRKRLSPRYSIRMFSKELDINPAILSMFFSGKRDFGVKLTKKISENLGFTPEEMSQFLHDEKKSSETLVLESQQYFLYSDPIYFSLLSLLETADARNDINWMALRLKTNPTKVELALNTLKELNLVKEVRGKLIPLSENIASLDNIPNYSLRIRHQKNMEDARDAVVQVEMEKRYFSFETLAFDPDDLPMVQKKINMLLDDLILLSKRTQQKKEVYEFCMVYFPRSHDVEV